MCGLAVYSEITLPGLAPIPHGQGTADVTVREAQVPVGLLGASQRGATWEIADERLLLRIPGIARFLLTAGCDVTFELEKTGSAADAAIFVLGTVFGILLHQRGHIVLHASAVRVGGKAALFCGPSGAGKSTLAAALGQRGYPLLNDDVCAIGLDQAGAPVAHSDGRQLKLWAQAIERLDLGDRRGAPVRSRLEKFYVEPPESAPETLPLGAIYTLRETRPPLSDGIERPNIVDAAILIRRNAYRPRLVAAMRQKAQYFQSAAIIAANAGVFTLTRPLDFAKMPDVISRLEAHWHKTGLHDAPSRESMPRPSHIGSQDRPR